MMNEDTSDMDLGLALVYPNRSVQTRLTNNSGAGVNAASRVDMAFVATHPLSELVWSPHKGLSVKCADCSLIEKNPSCLRDVGPSKMVVSPSHSIISPGTNDDKPINEINLIASVSAFHVDSEAAKGASLAKSSRSSVGPMFGSSPAHHLGKILLFIDISYCMINISTSYQLHFIVLLFCLSYFCFWVKIIFSVLLRNFCLSGTGGNMEEVNTVEGESVVLLDQTEECGNEEKAVFSQKCIQFEGIAITSKTNAGQESQRTTDFLPLATIESKPEPMAGKIKREEITNISGRIEDVTSGSQTLGLEIALAPEVHIIEQCEALDNPVSNLPFQGRTPEQLAPIIEESKNEMETHSSINALLEKMESTSENDLQHLIGKDACEQSEGRSPIDKSFPVEASAAPSDSRIHLSQRKGKEKALSDTDVNERMSKDEDDSHESVESCNSAGLFSNGKKLWSFEQLLIVGSKRIKKQIQETPTSTSFVRQDSSFMNWISNMVKGLPKSNQDECPLALTLSHPNHGLESCDRKNNTYDKTHNIGSRNMGFQSIFQSLYVPNTKVHETRMSNDNHPVAGAKELVPAEKICANITPISCCGENGESCKQSLVSNNIFNYYTRGSAGGTSSQPSSQPWIVCENIAATQETYKINSAENRTLSNLASIKEIDGVSSSDTSLDKQNIERAEKNYLDSPSEGKAIHNMGHRSDPLGSLWITRFSSKTLCPVLNLNHRNHSTRVMLENSTEFTRRIPQNHIDSPIDQKNSEARESSSDDPVNAAAGKELLNCATGTEPSISFKRVCGNNYEKPISKLNSPSQTFKSSEAMASAFARRLDALKSIIPSDIKDDVTRMRTTCFFCGKSGHDLRNCSEVKKTELEDLLKSINSHDGAEESPCLCIRCFQLDHWAIACPVSSSSRQQQTENDTSVLKHCNAGVVQLRTGSKRYSSMFSTKESRSQVAGEHIICNGKKPRMETDLSFSPVPKGIVISDKRVSCLNEVQNYISSSYREIELKENQIPHLCNSASKQISDGPKGMFDTIRRLRLSRMDILKWMNSCMSLSRLDGFFLRLRLGKWEGLGGTGYYVACINETQRESSSKSFKNSISVSVGAIKCLVESQYVSNHDFLEDELMAWWYTASRSEKIPTEDDLKSKLEERKKLGF